jgi:hypothetical protein
LKDVAFVSSLVHSRCSCLVKWAEEGVLLLNATLTVEAHNANSHSKLGWQRFTDKTISIINEKNEGVVFILFGAFAQKKGYPLVLCVPLSLFLYLSIYLSTLDHPTRILTPPLRGEGGSATALRHRSRTSFPTVSP